MASVWADFYHGALLGYIVDEVWVLMTLRIFLAETYEVYQHLRQLGLSRGMKLYAGFWNVVDWTSVFSTVAVIAALGVQYVKTRTFVGKLETYDYTIASGWAQE